MADRKWKRWAGAGLTVGFVALVFVICGCGGGGAPSGISIDNVSVNESDSTETANLVFTVTIPKDPAAGSNVTVDWTTADGTATIADSDYVAGNNTLVFVNGGALTQQVTVVVTGDDTIEPDEILYVDLSNAVNASIKDNQGEGTITDDDLPHLSIDDVSVDESDSTETADLVFTVTITKEPAVGSDVTVDWATANGTATTADSDYVAGNNTLTFVNGGALTQQVTVVVTGDDTAELDEILYVDLSGAVNAGITDNQGEGTITDDDTVPLLVIGMLINNAPMFGTMATAVVMEGLTAIDDATVTMNSVVLPLFMPGFGMYLQMGLNGIGTPYNADTDITLLVTRGTINITATVQVPDDVTITAPTGGSHSVSSPITVTWDAFSPIPDYVRVVVYDDYTQSGLDWEVGLAGTATTTDIPAGTLASGETDAYVEVMAGNTTTNLGAQAAFGSMFDVVSMTESPTFATTP